MNQQVQKLLKDRYMQEDEESWGDICNRVAKNIAANEEKSGKYYKEFNHILQQMDFVPNSPTLMNAGTDLQYLSACLVLPIEDSMEGIYEALKNQALVTKAGAGTGFSFSRLRPNGDTVHSTGKESSGPISFMKVFDQSTEAVKQGGRRKGANMGVLRVDHPDIKDFITCKDDENELNNFNISVAITDEFMNALESKENYSLYNPRTGEKQGELNANQIWNLIVSQAHKNGEPGLIFIDQINEKHPVNEEIEAVNVCGEQPLLPYESCNLGAINLANMIDDIGEFDYHKFKKVIKLGVRFLDNVIDVNRYPIPEIKQKTKEYRKIGLGVMGFAEMLIKMGIKYDSEEGLEMARQISSILQSEAINESERLAKEKGEFPGFDNTDIEIPRRNAVLTTVAPTGSRSFIAGTSGGIEPFFSKEYTHTDKDGNVTKFKYDFMKNNPAAVTAMEIEPEWHVRMQAEWQQNIGSSISKTINLPKEAKIEHVSKIYKLAYDLNCKGITIYRDGSRSEQVLSTEDNKQLERGQVVEAQDRASGTRYKLTTGCGTLYLTVIQDDNGNIIETFANSSNGGCTIFTQATSRLVSLSLRGGIDVSEVIDQLMSAGSCPSYQAARASGKNVSPGASCAGAIALKLKEMINEKPKKRLKNSLKEMKNIRNDKCPECGAGLEQSSGCKKCRSCGWSKCG